MREEGHRTLDCRTCVALQLFFAELAALVGLDVVIDCDMLKPRTIFVPVSGSVYCEEGAMEEVAGEGAAEVLLEEIASEDL